jgi:hypothetical protein
VNQASVGNKTFSVASKIVLGLVSFVIAEQAFACATCGCSLNSDAAMGYSSETGWQASLQFDYINQNQLRSGTSAVSTASVAAINDAGGSQEVEKQTINRYFTLGVAYTLDHDWSFRLQIPFVDRSHSTFDTAKTSDLNDSSVSGVNVNSLGDIKFLTNWQGLLPSHNLGLQFGIKLPTGNYGGQATDDSPIVGRNPVSFNSGNKTGNPLDASLQAGTGSTDLILGAFYLQPISQNFDAFINGQLQVAVIHNLDQAGSDFRPGNQQSLSLGLRYAENPNLMPQIQLNITHKNSDQGALADTFASGTSAYISPGISASITEGLQAFAFLQVPIYSNLQGYQLFPHWTASVGISHHF